MTENLEQIEALKEREITMEEVTAVQLTVDQITEMRLLSLQAYYYEGKGEIADPADAIEMLNLSKNETDSKSAMLYQSLGSALSIVAQQRTVNSSLSNKVQFCQETFGLLLLMLEQISPLAGNPAEIEQAETEPEAISEPQPETELATAE
jgi:hypothetical protein